MKTTQVIMDTGAHAAALAVKYARVDVVPGYPITPQTSIMEAVASMVENGELHARFIPVEGEHSAMAAAVAASAAGARVFTATSANGLLYMHEVLHMASGGRLPVVMCNVNRGIFAPWTLWADHQDSFSQRDTGWIQYHCSSNQEVFNTLLQAFRVAEQINIPVMVNFDGFAISHCLMPLTLPNQEDIDRFLPTHEPEWRLDPANPSSFSNVTNAPEYAPFRQMLSEDIMSAIPLVKKAAQEYKEATGMWDGDTIDTYRLEDAEVVAFAVNSMAAELRLSIDILREQGIKAGLLRPRLYLPFPTEDIINALPKNAQVMVLDRNYNFGHPGGILAQELKSVCFGRRNDLTIKNRVMGIGGIDLTRRFMADEIRAMIEE
ncbi:MAG TPA: pyruvate ferredoxin oxidoreductase [Syntrophomonadaceae bacterium]|nr:pyruvate ferredoxin oxidoreductase [Syntrophomonadaceae bacterium]HRX21957.1 pyruvate ferredoxin oxidoreductase [Syntrophomonadaceae bacterium]